MNFKGRVLNGKVVYENPRAYDLFLRQIEGKVIEVKVDIEKKKRSLTQNAYWYGVVCKVVGDFLGYDKDEVNDILEHRFLQHSIVIGDEEYILPKKVKSLTTVEFNELKENVQRWAASEFDLYIPDPEKELYF